MGRQPGACGDKIDVNLLVDDLTPLANQKRCGFDWELAKYGKSSKQQGPDREDIQTYHKLLEIILRHAPYGFPSTVGLKLTWRQLHEDYKIMDPKLIHKYEGKLDAWATECADKISIACKHVADLKRSKTAYVTKEVKALMDQVAIRDGKKSESQESPRQPSSATLGTPATPLLPEKNHGPDGSPNSSQGSVVFCGFNCNCPECRPAPESVDVCDSDDSETSIIAKENTEFVPAARGGQKRAAQADPEEKLSVPMKKPAAASSSSSQQPAVPAAASSGLDDGDVKIVLRNKPEKARESYIMLRGKYFLKCTAKMAGEYKAIIAKIVDEMRAGSLDPTKECCKARLDVLIEEHK